MAPSAAQVVEFAGFILRAKGDTRHLGVNWIQTFKRRNPRVKSIIGVKIPKDRINGATPEALNKFYIELKRVVDKHHIKPKNIFNIDEYGTATGSHTNSRVIAAAIKKRTRVKTASNREWVSTIKYYNALGVAITPLIIFKGASIQAQWFPAEDVLNWFYTHSKNGWTLNQLGVDWLIKIFIPETALDHQEARVLIYNSHSSHASVEFMYRAWGANIHLVFLPPHCSHVLQPLDLNVFGIMKARYRKEVDILILLSDDLKVKKRQFIRCYELARRSVSPRHI
jgi:4-hydroxybenzoate polyprenyltransferase